MREIKKPPWQVSSGDSFCLETQLLAYDVSMWTSLIINSKFPCKQIHNTEVDDIINPLLCKEEEVHLRRPSMFFYHGCLEKFMCKYTSSMFTIMTQGFQGK